MNVFVFTIHRVFKTSISKFILHFKSPSNVSQTLNCVHTFKGGQGSGWHTKPGMDSHCNLRIIGPCTLVEQGQALLHFWLKPVFLLFLPYRLNISNLHMIHFDQVQPHSLFSNFSPISHHVSFPPLLTWFLNPQSPCSNACMSMGKQPSVLQGPL